ncbi:MAG: SGNH/GDSL hydrolase family protein [Clostridia bacterium]|nr:SGNH/GDSL hydrolase family protein [Clostridia bacterium]
MIINFLGDSITAGAGASAQDKNYVALVGKKTGATVNNYGIGGTRIARQTEPSAEPIYDNDFLSRVDGMDASADFVFVFGGTNDYGHGDAPFGNEESTSEYTFCGAVKALIEGLIRKYGEKKLCFILPLRRYDDENPYGEGNKKKAGEPLIKYVEAIRRFAAERGVDTLDLRDKFTPPSTREGNEFFSDIVHPNDKGHALLAECIADYLTKKGVI